MSTDIWEVKNSIDQTEIVENNDFKMVTFSLGGKDYGIDIMKVKEILKVNKFTYVPNSEPYVKGVYNLRGDIISIIDFRKMFRVPEEKKSDDLENIIVLTIEDNRIGVIVDAINKVVAVPSETIKEPHPIFSNINVKYIMGIVERDTRIYIILDVDRILGKEEEEEKEEEKITADQPYGRADERLMEYSSDVRTKQKAAEKETVESKNEIENINKNFIIETLKTFKKFYITDINKNWFDKRFESWVEYRRGTGENIQLSSAEDADKYISTYYSDYRGRFYSQDMAKIISSILPSDKSGNIGVWHIGCGKGEETYSIASILMNQNTDAAIKVWANDNELISISNAPNLIVDPDEVPDYMKKYLTSGTKGNSFNSKLKDIIYFEYHDVKNHNPYPDVDIILCRDNFAFYDYNEQLQIISDIYDKLKDGGVLITGDNEEIVFDGLYPEKSNGFKYYIKK